MQVIESFFIRNKIDSDTIAVGVSGGADSLALVLLLKEQLPQLSVIALTVDHGLRPTSHQEAEYVAEVMKKNGIEHHILVWEGEKPTVGVEEKARIARYNLLFEWCCKRGIKYLAIAHHLLDQAETFLMRLERGSGLYGLSSMQEITEREGIKILRPLLTIHPDRLKDYLRYRHINWVEDESNQCTEYLRVKMRQFLPIMEEYTGISAKRICLAASNLLSTRKFIEASVEEIIDKKVHFFENCGCSVDFSEFMSWHNELKFYVVIRLIELINKNEYMPEASSLRGMIDNIKGKDFNSTTLGGIYFLKSELKLWLIKEYRDINDCNNKEEWQIYEKENPIVRGVFIPAKLRQALLIEKNHKK